MFWFFFMDFYIIFFRNFPDLIPLMFFFVGIICFFDLLIWSFRKCRNRKTGQEYAVKIVSRRIDCSQELKTIQLCQGHSNIIKIHGEFKDVVSKTHNSQLTTHNSQLTTNNRTPHTAHRTPHTAHSAHALRHTAHRTRSAHRTPHTAHRTPHTARKTLWHKNALAKRTPHTLRGKTQNAQHTAKRTTQNALRQNAKHSVAKRKTLCGKTQNALWQNAKRKTLCGKNTQNALWQNSKRSVAKRKTLCGKTQNALWQNSKRSVAKRKMLCGKTQNALWQNAKRSVAKLSVEKRKNALWQNALWGYVLKHHSYLPFFNLIFAYLGILVHCSIHLVHWECRHWKPSISTDQHEKAYRFTDKQYISFEGMWWC